MSSMALPFDDALDAAVDALQRGRPLDAVVSDFGRSGPVLRPLLETASNIRASAPRVPLSRALQHNYAIVRAALERAQMASAAQPHEPSPAPTPFWKRRLTFASLSLPVGALVLALTLGAAGATASLVVTDNGGVLGDLVAPVVPDAIVQDHDNKQGAAPAASEGSSSNEAPGSPGGAPGAENGRQVVTVDGAVSDVHGNTFTLTDGDRQYHVQVDAKTAVDGEILEGATAEVSGDLTAEKNLHATSVKAQGGTPDDKADKTNNGNSKDNANPDDNGNPDNNGNSNDNAGPGDDDNANPGNNGNGNGNGPPDDPGQPGAPPGQGGEPPGQSEDPPGSRNEGGGNGNANSHDNGNGNGGGPKKP
jgi:hypothetical protein